jgi:hypothetical protein
LAVIADDNAAGAMFSEAKVLFMLPEDFISGI